MPSIWNCEERCHRSINSASKCTDQKRSLALRCYGNWRMEFCTPFPPTNEKFLMRTSGCRINRPMGNDTVPHNFIYTWRKYMTVNSWALYIGQISRLIHGKVNRKKNYGSINILPDNIYDYWFFLIGRIPYGNSFNFRPCKYFRTLKYL